MTIKQLIEELQKLDGNMLVRYSTSEESYEPSPTISKYNFDTMYWDNNGNICTIPKETEFVEL